MAYELYKNFYLNEGYFDVEISQTSANIIQDNNFNLTYNINAGKRFFFNNLNLNIPPDYNPNNFKFIQSLLDTMKNEPYSLNSINNLLNEISAIDKKKSKTRIDFIERSGSVLEPAQQLKLLMFEPKMKSQVQRDIREKFKPSKPGGKKKGRR